LVVFAVELSPRPAEKNGTLWTLCVDGSSNSKSCDVGVVLEKPCDILIEQDLKFYFKASNNQAEYEAIIADLNLAIDLDIK